MLTQMIGQGGWDVYVTGVNGFVGKEHGQPFVWMDSFENFIMLIMRITVIESATNRLTS